MQDFDCENAESGNMENSVKKLDMLVVGAGFSGIYQLYKAREAGLSVRVLEAGDGVGGTWFWNRYPGARCDVESLDYSYSFCRELEEEWQWSERYAPQAEILKYMEHVVDRFALKDGIQLNARVSRAVFNDDRLLWTVSTESGEVFECTYLVMATGGLSIPQRPQLKGLDDFKGRWYHSAQWPKDGVDFTGQRVALIGTGSSGVQMVPIIAEQAAKLTVFQRTANFSVPAHNVPFTEKALAAAKARYPDRRAMGREAITGQFLNANTKTAAEMTEEEQRAELEYRWKGAGGGFRMLRTFADQMSNLETNKMVADFARNRIRSVVKDSAKADLLCPKDDLPFGGKRLCVDSRYYETFNLEHVDIVDAAAHPVIEATAHGLRTDQCEYKVDAIVFATGFDAMSGALKAIDIRGSCGKSLREKWEHGPTSYLGLSIAGFPNMFVVAGPGSPSVLSNMVHSIETHVDWIMRLLTQARATGVQRIEATQAAEDGWVQRCEDEANKTLYPRANSWYMGANIAGKPRVFMAFVSGVPLYRRIIEDVASNNYQGFEMA
ncbi:MAG: NAD(P)/FAD-dependent oxidoreductase [Hydrogenophaga sp.]|uniref:flavin-containing monooxygenase n=1 Tax=Hydrogenophaga sp. TaxID=1904254 RepID=UPI0027326058|nr:NAD(P)/FAD-dependent oxidoreductase [Hydrogenophaga sp.]MDP3627213.1 NAD(P)/FAD-dependent oxidoreductase [Hydrogenophaga sp.]